jgi:hypothetical protein
MRGIINKIIKIDITIGIIVVFLISLVISISYRSHSHGEDFSVLIAGTSFLFGILIAFLINDSQAKLSKVNEILKSDEANLFSLYETSFIFGHEAQNKIRDLLDQYLIAQIDYFLQDFKYSIASFTSLYRHVLSIEPKTNNQTAGYQNMLTILADSSVNRKKAETFVQDKMMNMEWIIILVLLIIQLFFIFYFNTGSIISIILSALLSTIAVTLVMVLRDMDSLKRKESIWIWEPLHNLFKSLDLLPYYPRSRIKAGRLSLKKGEKIRVASYPDIYPDMTNKKVEELEYGA